MNAKNLVIATALILTGSLFAQNSQKAELQRTANSPEIQKELRQPDGAAIFLKEDGSFQIFARGTGTYDFDDVDEEEENNIMGDKFNDNIFNYNNNNIKHTLNHIKLVFR